MNLNGGATPTAYQWLKDDVVIPSATAASYTATETGNFTCTLTYADASTVTTDPQTVTDWMAANSMGRYYNQNIKVSPTNDRFNCLSHQVPVLK